MGEIFDCCPFFQPTRLKFNLFLTGNVSSEHSHSKNTFFKSKKKEWREYTICSLVMHRCPNDLMSTFCTTNLCLVAWITNYLSDWPHYIRPKDIMSDPVFGSTGAPQGTVLAPLPFTQYHLSLTIRGCVTSRSLPMTQPLLGSSGMTERRSTGDLMRDWCRLVSWNHLALNTAKTKEPVVTLGVE